MRIDESPVDPHAMPVSSGGLNPRPGIPEPTYGDVRAFQQGDLRQRLRGVARGAALTTLAAIGEQTNLKANLRRPRIHFLYLHFVFRDEEENFRALLKVLAKDHSFIPYSEAVERLRTGRIDRPYIAFSVDDGVRNGLRLAEILEEFGARACFFVCDRLPELQDPEAIGTFCRTQLSMPPTEFLSWADMESLMQRGHEIGNHSARHRTLASLQPAELEEDILASLARLRARLGPDIRHFAWPRGRFFHMSQAAAEVVHRAGHDSCASAERGCHVAVEPEALNLCIRREHIIGAWPVAHCLYFLARSAANATVEANHWPTGLQPRKGD